MTLLTGLLAMVLSLPAATPAGYPADWSSKQDTVKVWNLTAGVISADPLGQFYIVNAGMLVKYDTEGDSAYSWSEPRTGAITLIDSSDPMRILVYQKDFNLLRFLNNRLAPLSGAIRLDELDLTTPLALALSRQGGFWVLDGSTMRLRLINQQLKTTVESEPLDLPSSAETSSYHLIESGDQLLLHIPGKEIQMFDLFANRIRKIALKVPSVNAFGDRILLVYPDRILLWKDPFTPEETIFNQPGGDIRDACIIRNKILIRTSGQVLLIDR